MTEKPHEELPPPDPPNPGASSPAAVGRRAGMIAYWAILAFIVTAGAFSIIPQALGIGGKRPASRSAEARCAREIRALKADLLDPPGAIAAGEGVSRQKWLDRWDQRYLALGAGCGALEAARLDLGRLRVSIASMLARYRPEQIRLIGRIERSLDKIPCDHSEDCEPAGIHPFNAGQ